MILTYENSLDIMKKCFPRWSDIRKRTTKSIGGKLLRSYAKEFDNIQLAIEDYQKAFFLINYFGNESDIVDYLYVAFVGEHDNIEVVSVDCEITQSVSEFYSNLDSMSLIQSGYIFMHESLLGDDTENVIYSVDDYTYKVKLTKIHIWNVFDEFALFAGIKRYGDKYETNKELAERTYAVFKNFPNPTDTGIKQAIKNAVINYESVTDDEIEILKFNSKNLDFTEAECKKFYEDLAVYNQDLFRTKIWDASFWEHSSHKT